MINLIPPVAKRNLIREYWLRVLVVWLLLAGCALLVGAALLLPPYVLIHSQVAAYEATVSAAEAKVEDYRAVSRELAIDTQLAQQLVQADDVALLSPYLDRFVELSGTAVDIGAIRIGRDQSLAIQTISVSGRADDRQSLAAFRDRLLAEAAVASVDLPLSNLASDRDINFSLTVTLHDTNETDS